MKKLINILVNYFNDHERWHEWGTVSVIALWIVALGSVFQGSYIAFAVLAIANFARVVYQEIWIERRGKPTPEDPDFWYDLIMRPVGQDFISWVILFTPHWFWIIGIALGFAGTYKWKVFRRKH